jgi:hypothetical protein
VGAFELMVVVVFALLIGNENVCELEFDLASVTLAVKL